MSAARYEVFFPTARQRKPRQRIVVTLGAVEHIWTLDEAREFATELNAAIADAIADAIVESYTLSKEDEK